MFLFGIIILILIFVGIYCIHYYYPRKVSFNLAKEIDKPNERFDYSRQFSYYYAENEKRLIYFLTDYYKHRDPPQQGYDSVFAYNVSKNLDYEHYDYIIICQKQLKALTYSPYLAKKEDWIGDCEKKKPLIPTYDTVITDKVYIYQIEKNNIYRSPGP